MSNAPWGSRPELARVRKLTLFLDPVALLLGEVKIGRILLEGADILVERNEVGDANLEMLPPPDGSGPHPGENRSLRLRTTPAFPWIGVIEVRDSVLTVAEGAGRPPVVLEVANGTLRVVGAQPAAADRGAVRRPAGAAARPHRHGRLVRRLDEGPAGQHRPAGRLRRRQDRDQGRRRRQGHEHCRSRPKVRMSRSSAPTSACRCRGRSLCVERQGGDPAQRIQGRSDGAEGRSERTGRRGAVPRRSQGRADSRGQRRRQPARRRASCGAPAAPAPAGSSPPPAQPRLVPTLPFAASWLGRSAVSVTVRLGEVVGLGSKMQNGSVTLVSNETALRLPRRRDGRRRLGRLRSGLRSDRPDRAGDADGLGQPCVARRTGERARPRSRPARRGRRHRPAPARRWPHLARRAEFGQRFDRHRHQQGGVAARPARQLAGRNAAPARRHRPAACRSIASPVASR